MKIFKKNKKSSAQDAPKEKSDVRTEIPWQPRPANSSDIIWRYDSNPVIKRDAVACSNSIFNSAVVPYKEGFAGVFRVDNKARNMSLHAGCSEDGFNFKINEKPLTFKCDDPEIAEFNEGYDPRVCWIDDRFYVTWCNAYHGATIGVAFTYDFEEFFQLENAFLPYNRNGVLFPRKIRGKYAMLSRPSDTGHTPFGHIFYSESPDMIHWGCHRHVMSPKSDKLTWQCTKIGAGPTPIETSHGWLMIYHGVLTSCNGYVYSMGAALLDIEKPWKVLYRTKTYLLSPQKEYECVGDVPNVVFPCACLMDKLTGRLAIYYGCADTVTSLAFCYIDELIDHIKNNSEL
jgi:beta-1,4-mannooligosaccharide/beta-1,4-mannosyl-N-acetylglucosamine phosphorylase